MLAKVVSGMEKCFHWEKYEGKAEKKECSALAGEEIMFEVAYTGSATGFGHIKVYLKVESDFPAEIVKVRQVAGVPVRMAAYDFSDDYFITKEPGIYPDVLDDIDSLGTLHVLRDRLDSLYITVKIPTDACGDYATHFTFTDELGEVAAECTHVAHVIPLPIVKHDFITTQWFHCDSLAHYYGCQSFDENHWMYIENFMRCAVENRINAILTPVFTPPLDTRVGGERLTTQLVDVRCDMVSDGGYGSKVKKWTFGYELFRKWVGIAKEVGVEYYEISHLYTQWGASHAPKVYGIDTDGKYKQLFGWDTDALGEDYREFLRAFIKSFLRETELLGIRDRCIFHISDEPNFGCIDTYRKAKEQIADLLEGQMIVDALSDFEFYKQGIVEHPIPANNHIEPFINAGIEDLWTYYCCGQTVDNVSNRMMGMPLQRTRVIGVQFWLYKIAGFLQWGYNFYNSQYSTRAVNPYLITDGDYFVPAGDCYSVYPSSDGEAIESLRIKAFTAGLFDMDALYMLEEMTSRDYVLSVIAEVNSAFGFNSPMTFSSYPRDDGWLDALRERINEEIIKATERD